MTRFGTEERNMARLSPVVAFNRISSQMTGWRKTVQVDHLGPVDVLCLAGRDQVVPHGIDADVLFALTTLYDWQGQPPNGLIRVSVSDLCNAAGLAHGGPTFERVRESLQRWLLVTYEVSDCWGTPGKPGKWNFRNLSFGVVTSLQQTDHEVPDNYMLGKFYATTILEITLNASLIHSMVIGHVRNIDINLLKNLNSPLTRILYRALEEMRQLPGANNERYTIGVKAWGDHLGLRTLTKEDDQPSHELSNKRKVPQTEVLSPTKIRRALAPAHEELIRIGYLSAADVIGRGADQQIDYHFGQVRMEGEAPETRLSVTTTEVDLNPELVDMLTSRRVGNKKAEELVRQHGERRVLDAIATFDAKRAAGYNMRNPGGLMVKIIQEPENYPSSDLTPAITPMLTVHAAPSNTVHLNLPEPPRTVQGAYAILGKWFEDAGNMRRRREQLAELFISGRISTFDLIRMKTTEEHVIDQHIQEWQQHPLP